MAKKATKAAAVNADLAHITEALRPLAVETEGLELDPRNARKHDERNVAAIAASLRRYGQMTPLVVQNGSRQVLKGNGTLLAARFLGWTKIAVVFVELDAGSATGYALADNRTAELAAWDGEMLAELLEEFRGDDEDLVEALALDDLVAELVGDVASDEEAAEKEKRTVEFQAGDGESTADQAVPEKYAVVVDCESEEQQRQIYEHFKASGYKCRLLVV